jgi:tetratricopeptide (TPR) repeat protein
LIAAGFSALANLAVVVTWGWTEVLEPPLVLLVWGGLALFWLVGVWGELAQLVHATEVPAFESAEDLFRTAQREYLRGNWFEAELSLNRLLEASPGDADSLLMLATLLRRIGQIDEARDCLRRLESLAGAMRWQSENARERHLLSVANVTAQNVQLDPTSEERLPTAA